MRSPRPRSGGSSGRNYDFFGDAGGPSKRERSSERSGDAWSEAGGFAAFTPASVPGASPESAVAVTALTETAKAVIEGALAPMWIRGDVSDFKRHRNGHWYFTLRDQTAQVRCVVWSRDQRNIPAAPDDGMEVVAYGQLTVYPARGDMHVTVTRMDAKGDGLWRKALEETRARLDRDGLLAAARKRRLPFAPRRIAVVTSPDGAAIRDIIAVVSRRAPQTALFVSPAKVQGDGAPEEICSAIERVTRWGQAEVMIVGRGGGGREDLWAFNDERVARAIAGSPIPVISAVGHEVDVTIADLVADYRAPTPSAAGEAVVPLREDLVTMLRDREEAMRVALRDRIDTSRRLLRTYAADMATDTTRHVTRQTALVQSLAAQLQALSPLSTLARGYAVARAVGEQRTLSTVADFVPGQPFQLIVRDGSVIAVPVEPQ